MPILKKKDGTSVFVPASQISEAARSGEFDTEQSVRMESETGQLITTTLGQAPQVVTHAGRAQTFGERDSAAQQAETQRRYGGVRGHIAAGAEGVGRGLTFGGSDAILDKLGVEGTEARQQIFRPTSMITEGVGAIAPAVLTGGTGAVATGGRMAGTAARAGRQALRHTPAGLAARAGDSIVRGGAARAAGATSRTGAVATRAGAAATAGAVEGSMFTTGNYISEVLMGDKDLSAEEFTAAMGQGALFGVGLGGGMSLLGQAAAAGARTSGRMAKDSTEMLKRLRDPERSVRQKIDDVTPGFLRSEKARERKNIEFLQRKEADFNRAERLASMADEVSATAPASVKKLAQEVRQSRQKVEEFLDRITPEGSNTPTRNPRSAREEMRNMDEAADLLSTFENKSFELNEALKETVSQFGDEALTARMSEIDTAFEPFREAARRQGIMQTLDTAATLTGAAAFASDTVDDAVRSVPGIGPLLSTLAQARAGMRSVQKLGILGGSGTGAGPMGKLAGKAGGIQAQAAKLVESIAKSPAARKAASEASIRGQVAAPLAASVLSKPLFVDESDGERRPTPTLAAGKTKESANLLANFTRRSEEISTAVANPGRVRRRIEQQIPINNKAMTDAIADAVIRKFQHLDERMPKDKSTPSAFGSDWEPSEIEVKQFAEHVRGADDPMSVLRDIESGDVSPQAVESFKAVYPRMYQEIEMNLLEQGDKLHTLPYERKVMLSLVFDGLNDPTMQPEYVQSQQSVFTREPNDPGPSGPAPTMQGSVKLSESEQTQGARIAAKY